MIICNLFFENFQSIIGVTRLMNSTQGGALRSLATSPATKATHNHFYASIPALRCPRYAFEEAASTRCFHKLLPSFVRVLETLVLLELWSHMILLQEICFKRQVITATNSTREISLPRKLCGPSDQGKNVPVTAIMISYLQVWLQNWFCLIHLLERHAIGSSFQYLGCVWIIRRLGLTIIWGTTGIVIFPLFSPCRHDDVHFGIVGMGGYRRIVSSCRFVNQVRTQQTYWTNLPTSPTSLHMWEGVHIAPIMAAEIQQHIIQFSTDPFLHIRKSGEQRYAVSWYICCGAVPCEISQENITKDLSHGEASVFSPRKLSSLTLSFLRLPYHYRHQVPCPRQICFEHSSLNMSSMYSLNSFLTCPIFFQAWGIKNSCSSFWWCNHKEQSIINQLWPIISDSSAPHLHQDQIRHEIRRTYKSQWWFKHPRKGYEGPLRFLKRQLDARTSRLRACHDLDLGTQIRQICSCSR